MHKKIKNQTQINKYLTQAPTYMIFLITKITNSINKPFQMNVLKQNDENVLTDNFKSKHYK